jgi:glycosyltransferase involved in cell wall biosynthesis
MKSLSERNPLTKILRLIEKHMLRKSSRILTVIQNVDQYTAKFGIPKTKIEWIPNGVDMSRWEGKHVTNDNGNTFTLMYCGTHSSYSGLDTILRAAKILQELGRSDIRLVFVGDGARKVDLIDFAHQLGLTNVEFRPSVPRTEVANVMAEASAFVIHIRDISVLRYGVSPNKLYDYMAAAKPVIYAVASSNNPIAECNAGLTAAAGSPEAIANAVLQLSAMTPEQRAHMGENGLRYVKANNDMDMLAAKLEDSLYSVCRAPA